MIDHALLRTADIASFFDAVADDASGGEDIVVSGPFALQSLVSAVRNNEDKVWFMEHQMLSADRIRELGVFEACGLVPFAENIDGDFLAAGQDDFRGTVHAVSAQGELEGRQEADCLADYLEAYRDMLLSHKLEYIEDCGMVEKSTDAESDNQHPRK